MENKNIPVELLEALDPTPDPPNPLYMPRQAWLDLVQRGVCQANGYSYLWGSGGVSRMPNKWVGHPEAWKHWEDIVLFTEG